MDKSVKTVIDLTVKVVVRFVLGGLHIIGGTLAWYKYTKKGCSDYAIENSKGAEYPDRAISELYYGCLANHGLGS